MTARHERERLELLGAPVDALTMNGVLDLADAAIERREPLLVGVVNAAKLVQMRHNAELRQAVLDADVTLADGMSVVWAARLLGRPLPERVTGIDLMLRLLERAHRHRRRVYFLGATATVLGRVVERVRREYPDLCVAGSRHGYFTEAEESAAAAEIAGARPDILLVAMSSPRKERFLARWQALRSVPVCHGVGGSFDVYAGLVRRAPAGWQRLGLEWLYRLLQEPRRMWRRYLVTNTLFVVLLARQFVRTRLLRAGARLGG